MASERPAGVADVAELVGFGLYPEAARRLLRLGPDELKAAVRELAVSNPDGLVRLAVELARDPAAFGRVLEGLRGSPDAAGILEALTRADLPKERLKEVRRELFRAGGRAAPRARPQQAEADPVLRAFSTPVTLERARELIILFRGAVGGLYILAFEIDPGGVDLSYRESVLSRLEAEVASLRRAATEVDLELFELEPDEARDVLWNRRGGVAFAAAAAAWLDRIGRPRQEFAEHPVYRLINRSEVRFNPQYLAESDKVAADEPHLWHWFIPVRLLRDFIREARNLLGTQVLLDEDTQRRRWTDLVGRAVRSLFDGKPEVRQARVGALEDLALLYARAGRLLTARRILAAALALADPDQDPGRVPLLGALVDTALGASLPAQARTRAEELGLWVPAQEAGAEEQPPDRTRGGLWLPRS
jgi:hypothetical protein